MNTLKITNKTEKIKNILVKDYTKSLIPSITSIWSGS